MCCRGGSSSTHHYSSQQSECNLWISTLEYKATGKCDITAYCQYLEFFANSLQYKSANIANFVLAALTL